MLELNNEGTDEGIHVLSDEVPVTVICEVDNSSAGMTLHSRAVDILHSCHQRRKDPAMFLLLDVWPQVCAHLRGKIAACCKHRPESDRMLFK